MRITTTDEARELIRFLITNIGHPVVLDRDDCALLAERVERAETLEEVLRSVNPKSCQLELALLPT